MKLVTYWVVEQGLWSPRDETFGWRHLESFESETQARRAIRGYLKDSPKLTLSLSKIEIRDAWNTQKPDWAQTAAEAPEVG